MKTFSLVLSTIALSFFAHQARAEFVYGNCQGSGGAYLGHPTYLIKTQLRNGNLILSWFENERGNKLANSEYKIEPYLNGEGYRTYRGTLLSGNTPFPPQHAITLELPTGSYFGDSGELSFSDSQGQKSFASFGLHCQVK